VAQDIDEEVQHIILEAYEVCRQVLTDNYAKLVQIARYLMANETVEGKDLDELFKSDAPPLEGAVGA
jgi:ATP-dependent Zn protease